jgi:hypothetical protein
MQVLVNLGFALLVLVDGEMWVLYHINWRNGYRPPFLMYGVEATKIRMEYMTDDLHGRGII